MSTSKEPDSGAPVKPEDWAQTMADVKRLVDALHTLIPSTPPANPKPEPESKPRGRMFDAVQEEFVKMFTPVPDTMRKTLCEAFLAIFLSSEDGESKRNTQPSNTIGLQKAMLPSFANKLTLLLSGTIPTQKEPGGTHELNRTKLCLPGDKARLKEYLLSRDLWNLDVEVNHDGSFEYWRWTCPPGGNLTMWSLDNRIGGPFWSHKQHRQHGPRQFDEVTIHDTRPTGSHPGASDFGALCVLQIPIRESIVQFRWIEFILAQTGFLNYESSLNLEMQQLNEIHIVAFLCFLGTFVGYWPSGAERAGFSYMVGAKRSFADAIARIGLPNNEPFKPYYAQIHFRYFTLTKTLNKTIGSDGLRCYRQQGKIESLDLGKTPALFEERRISIFGILSNIAFYREPMHPSIYRVLMLADAYKDFPFAFRGLIDRELKWHPGCGGVFAFQAAILLAMRTWETEWNNVLDKIDDSLRVQLDETMDPEEIAKWMFDLYFERSRLYFTILQILRIFGECIRTVSVDIKALDNLFLIQLIPDHGTLALALKSNWDFITEQQKNAEERLLRRLLDKTDEVKSLRDGLFNASSLREANRSTTMNRYVIIFTVVTVIYLPPSFVSTVFGMTIFQKSIDQTTREYKITMVVVSLITYLVALLSIIVVNWDNIMRKIHHLNSGQEKDSVKGNPDSVLEPVPAPAPEPLPVQPADPLPTSQESRPGDTEKKTGSSNEPQDLESAINEGASEAAKFRSSWHKWRK